MSRTLTNRRDEIVDQAHGLAEDMRHLGASTRQLASDTVEEFRDSANEYVDQSRLRMRQFGDSMSSRVQDKPLMAVLTATAIGFLAGVFWSRL